MPSTSKARMPRAHGGSPRHRVALVALLVAPVFGSCFAEPNRTDDSETGAAALGGDAASGNAGARASGGGTLGRGGVSAAEGGAGESYGGEYGIAGEGAAAGDDGTEEATFQCRDAN